METKGLKIFAGNMSIKDQKRKHEEWRKKKKKEVASEKEKIFEENNKELTPTNSLIIPESIMHTNTLTQIVVGINRHTKDVVQWDKLVDEEQHREVTPPR